MDDSERDGNRPRPRRHLINELAQQHQLRRNRGAILAWIEIEEAQVDLDVAVRRLQSATRQDALACPRQPWIVHGKTGQLKREVRLYRRADFRRALLVDIESTVRKLP